MNTEATSTGSGGGASVINVSAIVTVTATAHSMSNGDRTALYGCPANFGGIQASEINDEHIIRNVQTNTFDVVLSTRSTPTGTSTTGGGSSVMTSQKQIDAGSLKICENLKGLSHMKLGQEIIVFWIN